MGNRKRRGYIIIFIALLVLVGLFIFLSDKNSNYVLINGKKIKVEIADSELEREKGLMYRESLDENSGMLFIFPDSKTRGFWMKNTLIPLDILFIDDSLKIVDIKTAIPCYSEPCAIYTSNLPAKYVLEVNSGFSKHNNLSIGERIGIVI